MKKVLNRVILLYETSRGEKPIELFILSQNAATQAKTARQIDLLEKHGHLLGMPHSKKLHSDIYELRIRGQNELRILYCFKKKGIYLLHIFKKQTQKTPKRELETALKRLREIDS
jgi:phage-related protein